MVLQGTCTAVHLNWTITSSESLQFWVLNNTFLPIYVTTLDHICGRSLLGLRVRIPPAAWKFVSYDCWVSLGRSVRRTDHWSRGVLPRVVCLIVIVKPRQTEGSGPLVAVVRRGERKTRPQKDTPKERANAHTRFPHTAFFYWFVEKPKLQVLPRSKHTAYPLQRRTNPNKPCSSRASHETHKHFLGRYIDRQLHCALKGTFYIVFYCTDKLFGKS